MRRKIRCLEINQTTLPSNYSRASHTPASQGRFCWHTSHLKTPLIASQIFCTFGRESVHSIVNAIIAGHCAPGPCVVMSQIPWLLLLLLSCSSCNWGSCCHLEWRKRITAVSGLFVPAPVILPSVGSSHSHITVLSRRIIRYRPRVTLSHRHAGRHVTSHAPRCTGPLLRQLSQLIRTMIY